MYSATFAAWSKVAWNNFALHPEVLHWSWAHTVCNFCLVQQKCCCVRHKIVQPSGTRLVFGLGSGQRNAGLTWVCIVFIPTGGTVGASKNPMLSQPNNDNILNYQFVQLSTNLHFATYVPHQQMYSLHLRERIANAYIFWSRMSAFMHMCLWVCSFSSAFVRVSVSLHVFVCVRAHTFNHRLIASVHTQLIKCACAVATNFAVHPDASFVQRPSNYNIIYVNKESFQKQSGINKPIRNRYEKH